jgi:hypothetical protein
MASDVDRLLRRGWRIESSTPSVVVLVKDRRRTNHVGHALATLLTLGLWLPVWAVDAMLRGKPRRKVVRLGPDGTRGWADG